MQKYKPDEQLITILEEINNEDNPSIHSIKIRHREVLSQLTPFHLALAVEELVNRGTEPKFIESKLSHHIKLLVNPLTYLDELMPNFHVLRKLITEHHQIAYLIGEIEQLGLKLDEVEWLTPISKEFKTLIHITDHVHASSKHTDIEEQIIFPAIEKMGITVIPKILRAEHFEIRHHSEQLHELAFNCCMKEVTEIRRELKEIIKLFCPLKKRHVLVEEYLVYPIALEAVNGPMWDTLKEECERVGFCCF